VNVPPVAVADSATTDEGVAVVVAVLANDTDANGDALSLSSVTQGSQGTVTHDGLVATYTPGAGYTGGDSFTYVVSDGQGVTDTGTVTMTVVAVGEVSVIPQGQMSVVWASANGANKVLDGDSTTAWSASGSYPHEMILALGGSYNVSEFRYLPYSWTKCTQYEVYVSATNGSWGSAVAAGTWANDSTEKTASFPPTPGAFLRIRYLDNYCYVAEHNVSGVVASGGS
jgi:hypothetical protein